jgi:hypothetical protein
VERAASVRKRTDSNAAPARFTSRTRLRPSAAVRFGVNPRSPIRAIIEPSTIASSTRALATATSWIRSIQFARRRRLARGQPVEDEPEDDEQQRVEDAHELSIERVAEPGTA